MKICILTSIFPKYKNDISGIFIYKNSVALAEAGIEVHVIAPGSINAKGFEILDGVYVHRFTYWLPKKYQKIAYGYGIRANIKKYLFAKIQAPFFFIAFLFKTFKIAKECDIIHAQWIQSALPGIIMKIFYNIPIVISIRGHDIRDIPSDSNIGRLNKFILDRTDNIIALAPREKMLAQQLGNYKIVEMHNPLNRNEFNPFISVDKLIREFSLNGKRIVSFVGRLVDEKNALELIDAIRMIKHELNDVVFFIVGTGPQKSIVESRVLEFGLEDLVFVTGSRSDTNVFYAASDIFVAIDLSDNLWSNTMIEAMASGCACIVTDVGDTAHYLRHIDDVYIIPVGDAQALSDALLLLLRDETLRKQLAENALRYIASNDFYKQDVVKKLLSIYEEALTV